MKSISCVVAVILACLAVGSHGACPAHGTTYSGQSYGAIVSDIDGYNATTSYGYSEDCSWRVTCAADEFFTVRGLYFVTDSSFGARIRIRQASNNLSITSWTFDEEHEYYNTSTNDVYVEFTSGRFNVGPGFTLPWECRYAGSVIPGGASSFAQNMPVAQPCGSPNSGVSTQSSGTWTSDADGVGAGLYGNSETCGWEVRCGFNQTFVIVQLNINGELLFDRLTLWDLVTGGIFESYSGVESHSIVNTGAQQIRLIWETDSTVQAAGWTMHWQCATLAEIGSIVPPSSGAASVSFGVLIAALVAVFAAAF